MALIIISYDVDGKHNTVMKKCLKEKGYEDYIIDSRSRICYLPNTTLSKEDISVDDGLEDLKNCAKRIGAKLERAVAFEYNDWTGIEDELHVE